MSGMGGLTGAQVAIIGLGESGFAAAQLALNKGGNVYVSDSRTEPEIATRRTKLRAAGAQVELGRHDISRLAGSDLVVVSPGIPPQAPVLRELRVRGIPWISEPEFAVQFFSGPLIAVTGTNGKTTTTLLLEHLLEAAGLQVAVGGNVGGGLAPAASELALLVPNPSWYVLEMSSFQLSAIQSFKPEIGVFTNLFPDHLDRYECLEDYYADKGRIFENADEESVWVLPKNDSAVDSLIGNSLGRRFYFGEYEQSETHAFIAHDVLTVQVENCRHSLIDLEELSLLGQHNELNALAASLTAHLAGVPAESIADGLRSASPLPHRLELATVRNGVTWINDSKATNIAATRSALKSLIQPIILLVGGVDKGEDFASLVPSGTNLRAILAYGEAAPRIVSEIENALLVEGDMEAVTKSAEALAEQGDVVLLSPACSSFDMFDSYEDRGCVFSALARGSA